MASIGQQRFFFGAVVILSRRDFKGNHPRFPLRTLPSPTAVMKCRGELCSPEKSPPHLVILRPCRRISTLLPQYNLPTHLHIPSLVGTVAPDGPFVRSPPHLCRGEYTPTLPQKPPRKIFSKILKKGLHFCFPCGIITELSARQWYALLAQLDRASGYGPEGQGFESLRACQKPRSRKVSGFFLFQI